MKCRFCGTNLPDDARFCSGCGREVEREDVSAKEKNNNETEDAYYREIDDKEYEEIKKKKKRIWKKDYSRSGTLFKIMIM